MHLANLKSAPTEEKTWRDHHLMIIIKFDPKFIHRGHHCTVLQLVRTTPRDGGPEILPGFLSSPPSMNKPTNQNDDNVNDYEKSFFVCGIFCIYLFANGDACHFYYI